MRKLQGKLAVITGAGSGIGRATALELADKGCELALVDVNKEGLAETAGMVEGKGRKASTHIADVADRTRMEALADEVVAEHGRVDIVINNAGVSVTAPFEEHSLEDFEWIVGINFWGVVYGCKFFLPHLKRAGEGHIVNISSLFGIIGLPTQSSYAATKFAVRGFSESLRAELAEHNIGVTSVHPGGIRTNIVKSSRWSNSVGADRHAQALKFFETWTMPAEECARQIVRGIEKNAPRLLITRETQVLDGLKRLFPNLTNRLVEYGQRRSGLL